MITLILGDLAGDFLMAGETTRRQPLLRVAAVTCSQAGPLEGLGMRRGERSRHGMEHREIHAQQADHDNAKDERGSGVQ